MTMLRLNLRVWLTGPVAPAAAGLAALIIAAAILTVWASIRSGIPIQNVTATMLLPLALGGSYVTTLMLSPRPRPAGVSRAVGHRRSAAGGVPVAVVPALVRSWGAARGTRAGTHHAPGRLPFGRALRPAAVGLPNLPGAAAGPAHLTATVPAGGPL